MKEKAAAKTFAEKLRAQRAKLELSQAAAAGVVTAAGLRVSPRTWEKWELGTLNPEEFKQLEVLKRLK